MGIRDILQKMYFTERKISRNLLLAKFTSFHKCEIQRIFYSNLFHEIGFRQVHVQYSIIGFAIYINLSVCRRRIIPSFSCCKLMSSARIYRPAFSWKQAQSASIQSLKTSVLGLVFAKTVSIISAQYSIFEIFEGFFSCAAARAARQRAVRPADGWEPEQEVWTRLERRGGRGIQLPDHTCHVRYTCFLFWKMLYTVSPKVTFIYMV